MSSIIYLNELATEDAEGVDASEAERLFSNLIDLLRVITRRIDGLTLGSHVPLPGLCLGRHSMSRWMAQDLDRKRRVRAIQNRSPFTNDLRAIETETQAYLEHFFNDRRALGLGLAAWVESMAISVDQQAWNFHEVNLEQHELFENDAGVLIEREAQVSVRHATRREHLDTHADWLEALTVNSPRTPDEMWRRRSYWYPGLAFLPRVESQIRSLHAAEPRFSSIHSRLEDLSSAIEAWRDDQAFPTYGFKVTPEGDKRRQLCQFVDLDGVERIFDTHCRFTPGKGRIHFRLDGANRELIIAHVGDKL